MSLNKIIIIGRLTRDPELRTTSTGKDVVEFSIAVNKRIKPQEGADADFFRVKAWGQTAKYVADYIGRGRLVAVDGRLESRKYTDKDGNNREIVEIVADNVNGLDRPREDNRKANHDEDVREPVTGQLGDEYDPFGDE
jgi:single-strand DNA-binding protein